MKRTLKWLGLAIVAFLVLAQLVRPARTNPAVDPAQTLQAHAQVPAEVQSIVDRSCRDCHTNQTAWPWYTNVAPLSWVIVHDVKEGREHVNFSEWGKYNERGRKKRLEEMCEEVEKGAMPLNKYILLHPEAKLSEADKQTLCAWTRSAQDAMNVASPAAPDAKDAEPDDTHKDHKH